MNLLCRTTTFFTLFGLIAFSFSVSANPYIPGYKQPTQPIPSSSVKPVRLGTVKTVQDPNFAAAVNLYKAGKLQECLTKLNQVLAKTPNDLSANGLAGFIVLHTGGDPGKAEGYLRAALKVDPHNPVDLANLGSALAQEGKFAAAITPLKQAAAANPKDILTLARLGSCYAQTNDIPDSLSAFQKAASSPQCPPQVLMNYGLTLAKAKQFLKAAQVYERTAKLQPNNASAWSSAGLLYGMIRDYPSTARCLSQAIKLGATDPFRVRFIYGCALAATGKHAEAVKQFQYASILKPNEFAAWYDLGLEDEALGNYDDAISAYRQAHQLDPDQPAAVINLANTLIKAKHPSDAVNVLNDAIHGHPNLPQFHAALADVYLSMNDMKNANNELEETVKLSPNDNLSRASLAELDMRNKNYTGALTQYDLLLKAAPKSDAIMTQRGEALIDLKRYKDAVEILTQAVTINPKNARAWNNLGAAHEYEGNIKQAISDYKNGIAADPTLDAVRQNLARLTNPPKITPSIVMPPMTVKTGSGPIPGAPTPAAVTPSPNPTPVPTPAATSTPAPVSKPGISATPTATPSSGTITP
jgi:superkiller protein 3